MTFWLLATQLYCLIVCAHSEGARFTVPCAWRSMHLRLMSTLNYECLNSTLWSSKSLGLVISIRTIYFDDQSSFSNLSVTSPTSQLILQPFRCFTYVTVHSPNLLPLLLRHKLFCSFSNLSVTSRTHSPTLPSLYPRHSSFSNPSVASPTSQFILQPFFRFSYVTSSSLNSPGEPRMYNTCN